MNREILFRGKRTDNGEWVEGWVTSQFKKFSEGEILTRIKSKIFGGGEYLVDTQTVGQYTGLNDKNGKKIFEGDICKHRSNYSGNTVISVVTYTDGHFLALVCENSGFELSEKLEVIGNIHDNPELMEADE